MNNSRWLPTTKKEIEALGWEQLDIILFSGDAYVDHPSFGMAVIGRVLESNGFKVAIVPQPNWQDDLRDFTKLGAPRLFFGVTAGNMDSMVNHYTANKRLRSTDAYTPGNKQGFRPDYPTVVYTKILKEKFPHVPVVIGGIEASLRRLTHYDYWQDKLLPSMLIQSRADMLIYGMGEKPVIELSKLLDKGASIQNIQNIPQTCFISKKVADIPDWELITINSHDKCLKSKEAFMENFRVVETESNRFKAARILQKNIGGMLVVNPPYTPMETKELDAIHDLPFTRLPHPKYRKKEPIPAYEMIRHSVNIHRGCYGGCSFCTISMHQGKFVSSRSKESVLREVDRLKMMPDFKGHISDLGGPSANMYMIEGKYPEICKNCKRPSCIHPDICKNLNINYDNALELYRAVRNIDGIKKVTVGSGLRYDMLLHPSVKNNKDTQEYVQELIKHHVSGRLKVAPEHTDNEILDSIRKPSFNLFVEFKSIFERLNKKFNLNQQLIPYFISSLPGSSVRNMADVAAKTKDLGYKLEQIQDFTPTPMTLSNVMFYTGKDPYTGKKVKITRNQKDKKKQRQIFFWYKRENKGQIIFSLKSNNAADYISKLFR